MTDWVRAAVAAIRARADEAEDMHSPVYAAGLRDAADMVEDAAAEWDGAPLSLAEAAALSGYSVDHLRRLLADEKIPNAGRPGSPAILRADLPMKPGAGRESTGGRLAARLLSERDAA